MGRRRLKSRGMFRSTPAYGWAHCTLETGVILNCPEFAENRESGLRQQADSFKPSIIAIPPRPAAGLNRLSIACLRRGSGQSISEYKGTIPVVPDAGATVMHNVYDRFEHGEPRHSSLYRSR